jgi:hypothetical protein
MKHDRERCPTCQRAFKTAFDYPRLRILAFERLPIPEAVDTMSDTAAEMQLKRFRQKGRSLTHWHDAGINMTPEIERACGMPEMQAYLGQLAALVGQEVAPKQLKPDWKADGRFRWAHRIPGTRLYVSVAESEKQPETGRVAEVQVHCDGPNLGSAGGPTLQLLGGIARLQYEGLLAGDG